MPETLGACWWWAWLLKTLGAGDTLLDVKASRLVVFVPPQSRGADKWRRTRCGGLLGIGVVEPPNVPQQGGVAAHLGVPSSSGDHAAHAPLRVRVIRADMAPALPPYALPQAPCSLGVIDSSTRARGCCHTPLLACGSLPLESHNFGTISGLVGRSDIGCGVSGRRGSSGEGLGGTSSTELSDSTSDKPFPSLPH